MLAPSGRRWPAAGSRVLHPGADPAIIARVATRLGIPPELLGFDPNTTTVEWTGVGETREVNGVWRRDFSSVVAGTVLGLGVDALDIDRLAALLPTGPGPAASTTSGSAQLTWQPRSRPSIRLLQT